MDETGILIISLNVPVVQVGRPGEERYVLGGKRVVVQRVSCTLDEAKQMVEVHKEGAARSVSFDYRFEREAIWLD